LIEARIEKLRKEFFARFNDVNNLYFFQAPGRINLIGEHTDYNGGFVLPVCIDRSIIVGARPNNKKCLRLQSLNFKNYIECALANIKYKEKDGWANYPKGVTKVLQKYKYKVPGIDMVFEGDIPIGSGLSSSAALEVVSCLAILVLLRVVIKMNDIPIICQETENNFIGMKCGIMDQFVITFGKKGNALFLDCRNLQYEHIPIDDLNISIVITDTKKRRVLIDSVYNMRHAECEQGVKILKQYLKGIYLLRDVTLDQFEYYKNKLPDEIGRRCAHVVYENERVIRAKEYLKENKFQEFGNLMNDSHTSLKTLYEVSCPELDTLVEAAQKVKGVFGSRMTGAGFGGCIITLVEKGSVQELVHILSNKYQTAFNIKPESYLCQIEDGAKEIKV